MSQLSREIEAFKSSLAVPRPPVPVTIDKPVTVASRIPGHRWLAVLLVLILGLLGALLLAHLMVPSVMGVPATVLVVQPSPEGPSAPTVAASASFAFPSFPSGKSCTETLSLPADDQKRLSAFLESALCHSAGYDAWTIVGGHDSQDLKPSTRAVFKSNQGLAYHRASCIKRHMETAALGLQGRCSSLPPTLVIAAKPSSSEPEPHAEQVKMADRGGLVILYRTTSGEAP